ncbi:unnamed protein product [Rangifer tarandus platyrhynchus]|uniref:Uncharacterized protein n=1 Tax=Rangifer tarandus platyrhynchus TaxID=3082113 RepID=A0AC59ZI81_RANTA
MLAPGPRTRRRALSSDPGESARGGRAASTRPGPPPRRPADTVVAEASLPVAFPARAVPARLLDPRAPPYPGPAPGAGGPLPPRRPGSIQTVLPSPAPRSPRDPRSLPGVAGAVAFPAPPPPLHAGPGAEWASRFSSRNKEAAAAPSEDPPFLLTLRLWDAYILEGGHLLMAMAYTVLKVHRRNRPLTTGGAPQGSGLSLPRGSPDDLTAPLPLEHLLKLPLEGLQEFLQDTLARALEDEACPCSCRPPWLSYPGWSKTCPCPEPRGWRPSGLFSKLGWLCHAWPHGPTLCRPNILEEKLTLFTYS